VFRIDRYSVHMIQVKFTKVSYMGLDLKFCIYRIPV